MTRSDRGRAPGTALRVVLVDDQEVLRDGLRTILEVHDDIEVVGEAADGEAGVRVVCEMRPDVALVDIRMPVLDGIEATRRLTSTAGLDTRVLVLTTFDTDENVVRAFQAGASGFVLKDAPRRQLVEAVRTIAEGDALLAPAVVHRLVREWVGRPGALGEHPRLAELTGREREILGLAVEGLSNREIGERVHLSESTVKTHVGQVLAKLGLRDRVQAVVWAYETGLVRPGVRPPPPRT